MSSKCNYEIFNCIYGDIKFDDYYDCYNNE